MQSPVEAILGIAGGAADLVKRVMGSEAPRTGFDDQLRAAMNEAPKAERIMKGKVKAAKGGLNTDMNSILENPQATQIMQYLAALKSLGLNKDDARALLTGQGGLSDEGVQAIIKALGISGAELAQLMGDPELLAGLKSSIEKVVSARFLSDVNVSMQASSGVISDESLKAIISYGGLDAEQVDLLMADQTTLDGLKASIADVLKAGKTNGISDDALKTILAAFKMTEEGIAGFMSDPNRVSDLKAKLLEVSSSVVGSQATAQAPAVNMTLDQFETMNAIIAQFIASKSFPKGNTKEIDPATFEAVQAAITQDTSEIKESVMSYLTAQGKTDLVANVNQKATPEVTAVMPQVAEALDTLQDTLKIPKKTLQDIVFSADQGSRTAAVDEAVSSINDFLKANAGRDIPKQVHDAVGLLKGAMSKEEFARIENVFKSFNQDTSLIGQGPAIDGHMFKSLARVLGTEATTTSSTYTQQVIDQIRQALPSGIKAGEGSMTLRLNPPMLGRVDVDIRMQDGQVLATFKADQSVTRDILQQNMHLLKDALSDQGIKAAQFVVSADSFNSREHRETYAAWAGFEQNRGGSSRQHHDPGTDSPTRDNGEYGPVYGTTSSISASGVDIIA